MLSITIILQIAVFLDLLLWNQYNEQGAEGRRKAARIKLFTQIGTGFINGINIKAPPDRREIFAAVATATISPKFRVDCCKEIRVVIHTNATVSW
jgi:hypothetical protein